VIIAVSGGQTPEATGPQGACSTNRIPKVSPAVARGVTNWQKAPGLELQDVHRRSAWPPDTYLKVSRWRIGPDPAAALTLQRLRERLEMEALAAGHPRPEQAAALQLLEVGL